jgi:LPXTG-site transpeptidase (sortase) family protein
MYKNTMNITKKASLLAVAIFTVSGIVNNVSAQEFQRNLSVGSSGPDVATLQNMLFSAEHLKIAATGYFGPLTKNALIAWQKSLGIFPASGYFGPISRARVVTSLPSPELPPVVSLPPIFYPATTTTPAIGAPVRLVIPKLGVDTKILGTGVKVDGSLDAPGNIFDAGWYKFGAMPGTEGSAVLTGHVARIQQNVMTAKGIFYDINKLMKGDTVQIQNDRGETFTYVVRESRIYNPVDVATEVFYSENGSHLNLITCDGTWDPASLSYSGRLVVFTDKLN